MTFDIESHIKRQRAFSIETFGPGERTEQLCNHIRKELDEVAAEQTPDGRAKEAVDLFILAFDIAIRAVEASGEDAAKALMPMVSEKYTVIEGREWQDWRSLPPGVPNEHDRAGEVGAQGPMGVSA